MLKLQHDVFDFHQLFAVGSPVNTQGDGEEDSANRCRLLNPWLGEVELVAVAVQDWRLCNTRANAEAGTFTLLEAAVEPARGGIFTTGTARVLKCPHPVEALS